MAPICSCTGRGAHAPSATPPAPQTARMAPRRRHTRSLPGMGDDDSWSGADAHGHVLDTHLMSRVRDHACMHRPVPCGAKTNCEAEAREAPVGVGHGASTAPGASIILPSALASPMPNTLRQRHWPLGSGSRNRNEWREERPGRSLRAARVPAPVPTPAWKGTCRAHAKPGARAAGQRGQGHTCGAHPRYEVLNTDENKN